MFLFLMVGMLAVSVARAQPIPDGCGYWIDEVGDFVPRETVWEGPNLERSEVLVDFTMKVKTTRQCPSLEAVAPFVNILVLRRLGVGPCNPPHNTRTCIKYERVGIGIREEGSILPSVLRLNEREFPFGESQENLFIGYPVGPQPYPVFSGFVWVRTASPPTLDITVQRREAPPPPEPEDPPEAPPPTSRDRLPSDGVCPLSDPNAELDLDPDCCESEDGEVYELCEEQGIRVRITSPNQGEVFPEGTLSVPVSLETNTEDGEGQVILELSGFGPVGDPNVDPQTLVGESLEDPPATLSRTMSPLDFGEYEFFADLYDEDEGEDSDEVKFQVGGCRAEIVAPKPADLETPDGDLFVFDTRDTVSAYAELRGETEEETRVEWTANFQGVDRNGQFFASMVELEAGQPGVTLSSLDKRLSIDFELFPIPDPIVPDGVIQDPESFSLELVAGAEVEGADAADCKQTSVELFFERAECSAKITEPPQVALFPTTDRAFLFRAEPDASGSYGGDTTGARIAWRFRHPDLVGALELTSDLPGVTVGPLGATLSLNVDALDLQDGFGEDLEFQRVAFEVEARLVNEDGDDFDRECRYGIRTVFIDEAAACGAVITSEASEDGDPVTDSTLTFTAEPIGPEPPAGQAAELRWMLVDRTGQRDDVEVESEPGVELATDTLTLTIDFETFREKKYLNKPLDIIVERADAACGTNGSKDSQTFFVFNLYQYTQDALEPGTDAFNEGYGTCRFPPGDRGCRPLPRELQNLFQKFDEVDETKGSCVCSGPRSCTFIFQGMDDPVAIASGALVFREIDAGYHVPGEDFRAVRSYSSNKTETGLFGKGWRFLFERQIRRVGRSLIETGGFGQQNLFPPSPGGGWSRSVTSKARVEQTADGRYFVVTEPGGATFTYLCGTGRLVSAGDRFGNAFRLEYDGPGITLSRIVDAVGRAVEFTHTELGRVESMRLPNGDTWRYGYSGDSGDLLAWVSDPVGNTTRYGYTDTLLTSHTNAAGGVRRWEFTDGRVRKAISETGAVSTFTYDFENQVTTWTDPAGAVTTYFWRGDGLVTKLINPVGDTWEYSWSEDGRLLSQTDPDGDRESYGYTDGLLTSRTDPAGAAQQITRDPAFGLDTSRTLPDGTTWTGEFGPRGEVLKRINPLGEETLFTYNDRGQILTMTTPQGNQTVHEYDQFGNRVRTTSPTGAVTERVYDLLGRVTETIDPLGRRTKTGYLVHHLPVSSTDPAGGIRQSEYDSLFNRVREVDVDGAETRSTYVTVQGQRRVASSFDQLGRETRYEYDPRGRLTARVAPNGARFETAYDDRGRAVENRDALGNITRTEFNPDHTVRATVDALGASTSHFYDETGRNVRTRDAAGSETTSVYNERGFLVRAVDAEGAETGFEYDALGRLVKTVDALGQETGRVYSPDGYLAKSIDARGAETTYGYDQDGRQVSVTDALGGTRLTQYDPAGQVVWVQDPLGRQTSFEYDVLGRQTATIDSLGGRSVTSFNVDGTVAETVDAGGRVRRYRYDLLDRVIEAVDPKGFSVRSEYDSVGNRTKLTDENGNALVFEYDLLDRLTATRDAEGRDVSRRYDEAGRLVTSTNARGQTTRFEYDPVGRLIRRITPDGASEFAYDRNGRRVAATNAAVSEMTSYDPVGRAVGHLDGRGFAASHEFDANGNPVTSVDSLGRVTRRVYDRLNRLTHLLDPREGEYNFVYDAAGQMTGLTRPSGVESTWAYDALGRVTRIEHSSPAARRRKKRPHGFWRAFRHPWKGFGKWSHRIPRYHRWPRGGWGSGDRPLVAREYRYDAVGNLIEETRSSRYRSASIEYQYDFCDQLVAASARGWSGRKLAGYSEIQFSYDPAGNRLTRRIDGRRERYQYNRLNQLVRLNGREFEYDADGNLVSEAIARRGMRTYEWDAENNLVGVRQEVRRRKHGGGGGHHHGAHCHRWGGGHSSWWSRSRRNHWHGRERDWAFRYAYSPDQLKVSVDREVVRRGRRGGAGQVAQEKLIDRFWHGGRVIEDRRYRKGQPAKGARHRLFLAGASGVLGEVHSKEFRGGVREKKGWDRHYLQDALGSTVAALDSEGDVAEEMVYSPFGERLGDRSGRDEETAYAFAGLLQEEIPGGDDLYSAAFRHLRPSHGRWLKRDPAGDVDGPNLYRYVRNRPTVHVDPSGEFAIDRNSSWKPEELTRLKAAEANLKSSFKNFLSRSVSGGDLYMGPSSGFGNPFAGESFFNPQCPLSSSIRSKLEKINSMALLDQMGAGEPVVTLWRSRRPGVPDGRATMFDQATYMVTSPSSNRIEVNVNTFRRDKWEPGFVELMIVHESVHAVLNTPGHADGQTVPYSASTQYYNSNIQKGDAMARFYKDYIHGVTDVAPPTPDPASGP